MAEIYIKLKAVLREQILQIKDPGIVQVQVHLIFVPRIPITPSWTVAVSILVIVYQYTVHLTSTDTDQPD